MKGMRCVLLLNTVAILAKIKVVAMATLESRNTCEISEAASIAHHIVDALALVRLERDAWGAFRAAAQPPRPSAMMAVEPGMAA